MSKYLKGNFEAKNNPNVNEEPETKEELFEREAMKSLGGSIAFVSKKGFLWTGDDPKETTSSED